MRKRRKKHFWKIIGIGGCNDKTTVEEKEGWLREWALGLGRRKKYIYI